jgi:hypothetical protein
MKVASVNLDRRSKLPLETRLAHNKLEASMHKKCIQLSQPDEEMHNAFAELKKNPIFKEPQESIQVIPGGVVGDKHFEPNFIQQDGDLFYEVSFYNQISILGKERYNELNKTYNKNIPAGSFGENIQTEGLHSIESLSQGTILQFGDNAQIKITHLRTFCYKFANVIFSTVDEYFHWKKTSGGVITRLGVLGQVVAEGSIYPNDQISIVYTPPVLNRLGYIQRPHRVASKTPCDPPTST